MSSTFVENTELIYYRSARNKYLYIFNHETFHKTRYFNNKRPPNRGGTEKDVTRLQDVFEGMGYNVTVHNNLTHDGILDAVVKISKLDHTNTACLCFAFLTHGDEGGMLYASDRPYPFRDVTAPLESGDQGLVGTPKIYFVQACRGNKTDPGRTLELDGVRAHAVIPSHADFLIYNSSVEEHVSFRDSYGSFLIQELCNVIESHHYELDIQHIVTLVNRRLAYESMAYAPANKNIHEKKQMPEVRHTLTKLFKF